MCTCTGTYACSHVCFSTVDCFSLICCSSFRRSCLALSAWACAWCNLSRKNSPVQCELSTSFFRNILSDDSLGIPAECGMYTCSCNSGLIFCSREGRTSLDFRSLPANAALLHVRDTSSYRSEKTLYGANEFGKHTVLHQTWTKTLHWNRRLTE